jgi:hypothetical protein
MGKGLGGQDISNVWYKKTKETSGFVEPPMQGGRRSCITWTVEDDATIVSMIEGASSYNKIASALRHNYDDIENRWRCHLQH